MEVDKIKIIQIRNCILRNLDLVYPTGLRIGFLYQTICTIDELYDYKLLAKDITYLKAKGYIVYVDDAMGGMDEFKDQVVKLTAIGLEVAQKITKDPALEI